MISFVESTIPISQSVTYSCTFNNQWSGLNHPNNYPGDAHWSPPVIVSHNGKYRMWKENKLASKGVEDVSEIGGTTNLTKEINDAKKKKNAGEYVKGKATFNSSVQSQTFDDITLSPWFPRMSSVTMIAPSPDWFTGFDFIRPVEQGFWYESFDISTYPWDAGTETGNDYNLNNPAENPHKAIKQLTLDTDAGFKNFRSADDSEIKPVAIWSCNLEVYSCSDYDGALGKSSQGKTRNCEWVDKKKKRCRRSKFKNRRLEVWCPQTCGKCENL